VWYWYRTDCVVRGCPFSCTGQASCQAVSVISGVSAKFGICTVVTVNRTLVEDKMHGFKGKWAHFSFNKCPIYTHDSASAKFSTNSQETDNSVGGKVYVMFDWSDLITSQNVTLDSLRTLSYPIGVSHLSFNFLCLLLL
jgi:hypothetical protein